MSSTRLAVLAAALAALLASWTLGAVPASAHAALLRSDPSDGEQVATAPPRVTLTFSDRLTRVGTTVRVTGPDGDATDGRPSVEGDTVVQSLRAGLPAGVYEVRWQVASGDGHPVSRAFTFTVTRSSQPATTPPAQPTSPPPSTAPATADGPVPATAGSPPDAGGDKDVWAGGLAALIGLGGVAAFAVSRRRAR